MGDDGFEKTMEAWADHEIESAPDLHPTDEMYHLVRARTPGRRRSPVSWRPVLVAAAVAGLLVVAVLYAALIRQPLGPDLPPGQEIAYVSQREVAAGEKGITVKEPVEPKGKGPKRGQASFERLWFQIQKQGFPIVASMDMQAPQAETPTLTTADNYRLLLESLADGYVYVFQLTPANLLVQLFPNEMYSPARNPLQGGTTHYLPSEPNWFYPGQDRGAARLYVVASAQPHQELQRLYARYSQADDATSRQEALSRLLKSLDVLVAVPSAEAAGYVLIFDQE